MVNNITYNKNVGVASGHEYLSVQVTDSTEKLLQPPTALSYVFIEHLAGTRAPDETTFINFSRHPNSNTILESIVQTLHEIPTAVVASVSAAPSDYTSVANETPALSRSKPSTTNSTATSSSSSLPRSLSHWQTESCCSSRNVYIPRVINLTPPLPAIGF